MALHLLQTSVGCICWLQKYPVLPPPEMRRFLLCQVPVPSSCIEEEPPFR